MMRKKSALHLENRYTTMIENAFYYSNPPEVQQMARKVRPPMHEYIRKLLYKDLSKTTTEKVNFDFLGMNTPYSRIFQWLWRFINCLLFFHWRYFV